MKQIEVIRLVKSLSSSEKRFFKLHTKRQSGNKDYLDLFDIIDKSALTDLDNLQNRFRKKHPGKSWDNTSRYLIKLLTDCLIQSRSDKDVLFQLLQGMLRVKILQERSLPEEGLKQLKKIRHTAVATHHYFIEYLTYRYELNYFSDTNFSGLTDDTLVKMQMKAKSILKNLNHIQDHYSLFELLKYRLVHSGKISSDEEKKQLNDLMLSEMILVAGKSKDSFAAQKLHLLFQSFFFTDIGDYQSALKTFSALNRLFEQNLELLEHPPLDYLSTLNGILDSLHTLGKYEEIAFYIGKIKQLDKPAYPEYFRYQTRKTVAVYQLMVLTANKKFPEAAGYINSFDAGLLTAYNMINEELQWELYFYCSLTSFGIKNWKKAHRYIDDVTRAHKAQSQMPICKALRLLNIIIYFEKGDTDYLQYEIRSYKRFFGRQNKLLRSERLLLQLIQHLCVNPRQKPAAVLKFRNILSELESLQKDKYEKQLLKYFDFVSWIMEKL